VVVVNHQQFSRHQPSVKKPIPTTRGSVRCSVEGLLPGCGCRIATRALHRGRRRANNAGEQRSALKNMWNNILRRAGLNSKEAVERDKLARSAGAALRRDRSHRASGDRGADPHLNNSIAELDKTIGEAGSNSEGHKFCRASRDRKITGEILLLIVIGDVKRLSR